MTSKSSYINFAQIREIIKRNTWAVTLSWLALFFTVVLPVIMTMQTTYDHRDVQDDMWFTQRMMNALSLEGGVLTKCVIIVLAIAVAVSLFGYLHSRNKTDFYHSMPIRRGQLFWQNYISGVLIVLPAYLAMKLAAIAIAIGGGYSESVVKAGMGMVIATHIIFFMAIYALMTLCMTLCGNTIVSLILFAWASFSALAAVMLWQNILGRFYTTYVYNLHERIIALSPIAQYFSMTAYRSDMAYGGGLGRLVCYAIFAAAVTILTCVLFCRRKSECAGGAIAFRRLRLPLKIWCVTIMAMAVGSLFQSIMGLRANGWLYAGFFVGGVLTHCLMEMIYDMDFRAFRSHWKTLAVYCVVCIAVIVCMANDITGFNTKLPNKDNVVAVSIDGGNAYSKYLETPENIDLAMQMMQQGIADLDNANQELNHYVEVDFRMKSGALFMRKYDLKDAVIVDTARQLETEIRFSDEYKQKNLTQFDVDVTQKLELSVYSLATDYNSEYPEAGTVRQDVIAQLIEASKRDVMELTAQEANENPPVLLLTIGNDQYMQWNIPIYSSYTETLDILKREMRISPSKLTMDDVLSLKIRQWGGVESYDASMDKMPFPKSDGDAGAINDVSVTDKADIEALLKNGISQEAVNVGLSEIRIAQERGNHEVIVVDNMGVQTFLVYIEGDFPQAVFDKYFPAK